MPVSDYPDFITCLDAMRRCQLPFSPSEAQAVAVGLLAGAVGDREQHWANAMYAELDPDDALAQECRACLDSLYRATGEAMQGLDFGLQLFLPPADCESYGLGMALRDWAQGFLYGFGLAGEKAASAHLSQEGREALHDFYEIGNLDVTAESSDEEEQAAISEIEEYLRVASMLIYEDMHARQPSGEVSHEIH